MITRNILVATAKKGWNPENGLDEARYLTYYKWTGTEETVIPLQKELYDFAQIRLRART